MNIFEKLMMISNEIGTLNKDLNVEMSNGKQYSAISEKSVLDAVKPLEYKYRVFSYPVKRTRTSQTMRRDWKDANGQARVTTLFVDRVDVTYRFVNVDDPSQFIEVDSFGTGIDTGDKGPGKAMTYADKYALMKAYKLAAGNASDPDTFGSPDDWGMDGFISSPSNTGSENTPAQPENSMDPQQMSFPAMDMQDPQEYAASLETLEAPPEPDYPSAAEEPPAATPAPEAPVDLPAMTVEEAREFVVTIGTEKGKTLGEVLALDRPKVEFYASDKFKNQRHVKLKAAARCLLDNA